ncbi:DMT family transporter [Paraburkholderia caballeronis]|uniref:DMT family transporter n=1 Tax=Paraburkholderia caballeronis TaxID=416943 RepID=UPI0010669698|nr:DMT family transporter [Paraburkholderia caballeronis]TDV04000.1 putative membrane protein [Paraburkholderia caballeronis]TDV07093.1 putative membrane protein [Paraburkholderia caballeronis]TDV17790.1 putative membrane protein [Paraburkholderia caballeronis]
MSKKQAQWLRASDLLLLAVALVWGTSYGVVKHALAFYPVLGLLALRFGLTFVLLSPSLRALRDARRRSLAGVFGAGVLLFGIFVCETFGVMLTQASNAAFLISLCVVLTPLVEWAVLQRQPTRVEWGAVALSLAGAWLLSGGAVVPNRGDALVLLAALLRALNVCVTKRVMRDPALKPLAVTAVQAGVVSFGSVAVALLFAPAQWQPLPSFGAHGAFWASVLYLVIACTLFAFFVQNYAVSRSSATRVALLMGSEPAFGALFACVWLGERLPVSAWLGGALIVVASLLATVRWSRAASGDTAGGTAPALEG